MATRSLGPEYFEHMYAESDDPWNFSTSPYEAQKYEATLAALGSRRFHNAFEIGCSIGVLTAKLAQRCDSLLSVDLNERALAQATVRCRDIPNVRLAHMMVPQEFPSGPFDLVLVSEVGYYWSDADLKNAREMIAITASGGLVELVHFLPKVTEYPRDGDSVHAAFLADSRFTSVSEERAELYRIDVFSVR